MTEDNTQEIDEINNDPFYNLDQNIEEEIIKDPTSFVDPIDEMKKKKRRNIIITTSLIVLTLVIGGGVALNSFKTGAHIVSKNQTQEQQTNNKVENVGSIEPDLPFAELHNDSTKTPKGAIGSKVKKNVITVSNGYELTVTGEKIKESQTDCSVSKNSEFCLAARSEIKDRGDVYFYLLKDSRNSRLMESPEQFNQITIDGSKASATMNIKIHGSTPSPIVAISFNDNSGFIIALPEGLTSEEISDYTSRITVTSKG